MSTNTREWKSYTPCINGLCHCFLKSQLPPTAVSDNDFYLTVGNEQSKGNLMMVMKTPLLNNRQQVPNLLPHHNGPNPIFLTKNELEKWWAKYNSSYLLDFGRWIFDFWWGFRNKTRFMLVERVSSRQFVLNFAKCFYKNCFECERPNLWWKTIIALICWLFTSMLLLGCCLDLKWKIQNQNLWDCESPAIKHATTLWILAEAQPHNESLKVYWNLSFKMSPNLNSLT